MIDVGVVKLSTLASRVVQSFSITRLRMAEPQEVIQAPPMTGFGVAEL